MSVNSILFEKLSGPIEIEDARERHLNYLLHGDPYIVTRDSKIIHSLHLERKDLLNLWENGKKGVRLYFCKEDETGNALNIILVPIGAEGENDISSGAISNTLEPCPDKCPPLIVLTGAQTAQDTSFSKSDLNYVEIETESGDKEFFWYKPNNPTNGKIWYDSNKHPVDDPRPESAVASDNKIRVTYTAYTDNPSKKPKLVPINLEDKDATELKFDLQQAQRNKTRHFRKISSTPEIANKYQYKRVAIYLDGHFVKHIPVTVL